MNDSKYSQEFLDLLNTTEDPCEGAWDSVFGDQSFISNEDYATNYTYEYQDNYYTNDYNSSYPVDGTYHCAMSLSMEYTEILCNLLRHRKSCEEDLRKTTPENVTYCPGEFDGFMCWPHGQPDELISTSCPDFLLLQNETSRGHRFCNSDGTWHERNTPYGKEIWSNKRECNPFSPDLIFQDENNDAGLLDTLTYVYTIGDSISLCCLIIALLIFCFFKKLHCTRNYIHCNLMISFIMRYSASLIKSRVLDSVYNDNIHALNDMEEENLKEHCDQFEDVSRSMISCRLALVLTHYSVLSNYFWLLVEGIYLQFLLSFPVGWHYNYFPPFMAFGWGAPWIPVGIWTTLMLVYQAPGCWELLEIHDLFWLLRIPIILSISITFAIFLNIIRIIVSKLKAKHMTRSDYKYRLARSTLSLIPLLGIHYIVFLPLTSETAGIDSPAYKAKMAFELTVLSIQGTLVAFLYCFFNEEVQGEIVKYWKNWKLKHHFPTSVASRNSSMFHSNNTQVMSTTIFSPCGESGLKRPLSVGERESSSRRSESSEQTYHERGSPLRPLMENERRSITHAIDIEQTT